MNRLAKYLFLILIKLRGLYLHFMDRLYALALPSQFKACGQDIYIYYPAEISGFDRIEIGHNFHLNRGAFIRGEGGLKIGSNVHIGKNLVIYTINHNYLGDALPYDASFIQKPVIIGDNVWIGVNVTIIPGVTIGDGAIIGAGTVVSRDVPPLAIVGSTPPRILKYRDQGHYQNLLESKKFGGVNGELYSVEDMEDK